MPNTYAELLALARSERDALLERRMREGEDPALVIEEIPDVEEFLVRILRDDELEQRGLMGEYALARLAQQTQQENAAELRRVADGIDAGIYRGIARRYPKLSRAVWRMLGDVEEVGSLEEPALRRST